MQAGKNATGTAKETATAKSGMDKTKATVDGKVYIYGKILFSL
jgi:hypothetical protein